MPTPSSSPDYDVLIIGAGAAGLNALRTLHRAGRNVLCLEARNRIGGRISTVHSPDLPLPVELGPEFIHGRPPQTWKLLGEAGLAAYDCEENAVHLRDGRPLEPAESWDQVDEVTEEMKRWEARGEDIPFAEFLRRTNFPAVIRQAATNFVEGFNAARAEEIGIASLARDARAGEAIDSDYNFRIVDGYDRLPHFLAAGLADRILINHTVTRIDWSPGRVQVESRTITGQTVTHTAHQAVLTLPLGVLQSRSVHIEPAPAAHLAAADRLRSGHVVRLIFQFGRLWWEDIAHFRDAGFWLSNEKNVPTWWTALPFRVPLLVAWSAGPHADALRGRSLAEQAHLALQDLSRITTLPIADLEREVRNVFTHDWSVDPFARGAYSYVPAGALGARNQLAQSIEETLFFAGEAVELEGHSATVHGALATGDKAARAILGLG